MSAGLIAGLEVMDVLGFLFQTKNKGNLSEWFFGYTINLKKITGSSKLPVEPGTHFKYRKGWSGTQAGILNNLTMDSKGET